MNTYNTSHKTLRSTSSSIHGGVDSNLGVLPKLDTDQRATQSLYSLKLTQDKPSFICYFTFFSPLTRTK